MMLNEIRNYQFDDDKIVEYLSRFKSDLPALYSWNPNIQRLVGLNVLSNQQLKDLNSLSSFEKEIHLKQLICHKLSESHADKRLDNFNELCLWVIKDWGGITGGKEADTLKLIQSFLTQEKAGFNRIASISKVASFMYPERYVIYDSRVAYSLNWIILSQGAGDRFFPIPEGRNSKMVAFDMNVLIRLMNIENFKVGDVEELDNGKYINNMDKKLFIPKSEAYSELNKLIRLVSEKLWSGDECKYLYYTEMLLFSIADREVFEDITNRVSIGIK